MKAFHALALYSLSLAATAATAPALTGTVNINDAMISDLGRSQGLRPVQLPVSVEAEVLGGKVAFAGFQSHTECLEWDASGAPPGHIEMYECVRSERRWTPVLSLSLTRTSAVARVGGKLQKLKVSRFTVDIEECVANLEEVTVVADSKPTTLPAPVTLRPDCRPSALVEARGFKLAPASLGGVSIEGTLTLSAELTLATASRWEVSAGAPLSVNVESVTLSPGMADFGGFGRGSAFNHYDRVLLH